MMILNERAIDTIKESKRQTIMDNLSTSLMTDEDWINQGKADAWAGNPKDSPEHNPQAASMYDLGYCEGEIERSPLQSRKKKSRNSITI